MSLRAEWEFEYNAGAISEAAKKKATFHAERSTWWKGERDKVVKQLKESGLEITEYEVTGGQRHNVQFDPKLTERLSECGHKIKLHNQDAEKYAMYARVLAADDGKRLSLHPDDVDYFGLA